MENIHIGHRQRLKDRFLKEGLENFSDVNVLELVLFYAIPRKDTNPIAHALLDTFGSLQGVFAASAEELAKVKGMSENAATLLTLTPQLLQRYLRESQNLGEILTTTEACGKYLMPHFFLAKEEQVWLLSLDAKCKVLDCRRVQLGSVNTVGVSVRKVVETALRVGASSVVLAHNHTSGIALPSQEDRETTRQVYFALKAVGVIMADHIIVAGDDFVSLAADGFFEKLD